MLYGPGGGEAGRFYRGPVVSSSDPLGLARTSHGLPARFPRSRSGQCHERVCCFHVCRHGKKLLQHNQPSIDDSPSQPFAALEADPATVVWGSSRPVANGVFAADGIVCLLRAATTAGGPVIWNQIPRAADGPTLCVIVNERVQAYSSLRPRNPQSAMDAAVGETRKHQEQLRLWNDRTRFRVVPSGRRSGKTELAKRRLVLAALTFKNPPGRYFAAAQHMTRPNESGGMT